MTRQGFLQSVAGVLLLSSTFLLMSCKEDDDVVTSGGSSSLGWWQVDQCSAGRPYTLKGVRWPSPYRPKFHYDASLPTAWRAYVDYAGYAWNQVGTNLEIRKDETVVSAGAVLDHMNVVSYGPIPSGVLGQCYLWIDTTNARILEADIKLNSQRPLTLGCEPGKFDVWSVLTHEFGHFCGLDHVDDRTQTMYRELHDNSMILRTLCDGDKSGLRAIY